MRKKLYKYLTSTELSNNLDGLEQFNHYSALDIEGNESYFKEWWEEPPIPPVSASSYADICLVDNGGNKYIVDGGLYNLRNYPSDRFTPIGVVVVPASHTDDKTARVMSLVSMDYNNPDSGNDGGNVQMYWGGYGYEIEGLQKAIYSPLLASGQTPTFPEDEIVIGWNYDAYRFPSQYYKEGVYNPYVGEYYGSYMAYAEFSPSPYNKDGTRNEFYSVHYQDTNGYVNRAEQMDGSVNSQVLVDLDNSSSTDWQTAEVIENIYDNEFVHPAAQVCWRFHTTGTTHGEWYLPTVGELGYLGSRWVSINNSLGKVRDCGFRSIMIDNEFISDDSRFAAWSSTVNDAVRAFTLYFAATNCGLGNGGYDEKNLLHYVRAFLKVG